MPQTRSFEQYGRFDDAAAEFVITDPHPPRPWINYLSNHSMIAILNQGAGGMVYHGSAATGRMTRHHQYRSVPIGQPGPWVYVREKSGRLWSPSYEPCRTPLTDWRCRHGLGYSTYEGTYRGLSAEATYFIAPDDDVLLWDIRLRNGRSRPAEVLVAPFVEFSFLYAIEEVLYYHWSKGTVRFEYDRRRKAIKYHYVHYYSPRRFPVFLSASRAPAGFTCSRDAFIGRAGTYAQPEQLAAGKLGGEELPGGGMGAGVLGFPARIAPGRTWRVVVALGAADDWKQADRLIGKYRKVSAADGQRRKLDRFYQEFRDAFRADLPDADMQRFVNVWSPYNCRQALERMRSASSIHGGYEAGGVRTRDTMQDSQGFVHLNRPGWVRETIELTLAHQHPQGCLPDEFDPAQPKEHQPHTHKRGDNAVWCVFTTHAYVSETGDLSFLDKPIPYYRGEEASVFDHLRQGLKYIWDRRGPNDLCVLWHGDWNDEISQYAPGDSESIMTSAQLAYAAGLLAELAEATGRDKAAGWCRRIIAHMRKALNTDAVWDGAWYRRILFADGKTTPLGSAARCELKLYPNAQSWCVICGAASPQRGRQALDSAYEHNLEPWGLKMVWPAATGTPAPPAPLLSKQPGVGENGGVFNQPNAWAMMAETVLGRGDQAYDLYRRCLPPVICDAVGADRYANEPYCYSSHVLASPQPEAGTAELPWLTGTAACMYLAATQWILGIRPVPAGLQIDPCIPSWWKGFSVRRRFRGVAYDIQVRNPDGGQRGLASLTLDGKPVQGNVVLAPPARRRAKVVATLCGR